MSNISSLKLGEPQLNDLNLLLYGKDPIASDVERWHKAGFVFDELVTFGLVQTHGGMYLLQ